jgi:heptosyltransferase II
VQRVIIFAPNWLGDAVMALPAIADVRRGGAATIAVAARSSVAGLFSMVADVDEVVVLGSLGRGLIRSQAPREQPISEADFTAAILLPNSFRSAVVALRAGIPERWGYRTDWRRPLLTRAIDPAPSGTHQIDSYQRLVGALGFATQPNDPVLDVPEDARVAASCVLRQAGWDGTRPLVALAPGAAFGSAKRWPAEFFAAVARDLAKDGFQTVILGGFADASSADAIASMLGPSSIALNLIGRTDVPTLAGVLLHARSLISNDSGAMHLGAAVGLPVTAVFGPTDERLTGPRLPSSASPRSGAGQITVLTNQVWCRPCMLRECPLDHACMRGVSASDVLEATRRTL